MALSVPLLGFDEAFTNPRAVYPENLTNEELMTGDWAKIGPVMQDFNPYFLDKRYFIQLPTEYSFVAWYPWVQNYHGNFLAEIGGLRCSLFTCWA